MQKWVALAVTCATAGVPAWGQSLQDQTRALAEIRRTAMMFCPTVDNTSQVTKAEAKAQVEASLPGLFKRLIDLGVGVSGSYANTESRGVMQNDLASLIASTNTCRVEVLKTLQDKMLSAPAPRIVPGKPIPVAPPAKPRLNSKPPVKTSISAPAGNNSAKATEGSSRTVTKRQSGPTLKIFFKNNVTSRDIVQIAKLLPSWKVVPGNGSLVDPSLAADVLLVNRDVVSRDEVIAALQALSLLGVPVKAVIPAQIGGRREIQVGTITENFRDEQENALKDNEYLSIERLKELQGSDFWRAAWNEAGYCGRQLNYPDACTLDKDARPVF